MLTIEEILKYLDEIMDHEMRCYAQSEKSPPYEMNSRVTESFKKNVEICCYLKTLLSTSKETI
jgi:hypothetical protein